MKPRVDFQQALAKTRKSTLTEVPTRINVRLGPDWDEVWKALKEIYPSWTDSALIRAGLRALLTCHLQEYEGGEAQVLLVVKQADGQRLEIPMTEIVK